MRLAARNLRGRLPSPPSWRAFALAAARARIRLRSLRLAALPDGLRSPAARCAKLAGPTPSPPISPGLRVAGRSHSGSAFARFASMRVGRLRRPPWNRPARRGAGEVSSQPIPRTRPSRKASGRRPPRGRATIASARGGRFPGSASSAAASAVFGSRPRPTIRARSAQLDAGAVAGHAARCVPRFASSSDGCSHGASRSPAGATRRGRPRARAGHRSQKPARISASEGRLTLGRRPPKRPHERRVPARAHASHDLLRSTTDTLISLVEIES